MFDKQTNIFNRKMTEQDINVMSALDKIEQEMKKIGFWSFNPPKVKVNSYLEAPSFELWLQCVFIPNAREAVKTGKYPNGSQVGLMALREYDYHSYVEEAQNLLKFLSDFDEMINQSEYS